MGHLLQLLENVRRQKAGTTLALDQHVQKVAHCGHADAPAQRLQQRRLGQLQLLRANVEQRSVFPRTWHRTVNDEFKALQQKTLSMHEESTRDIHQGMGTTRRDAAASAWIMRCRGRLVQGSAARRQTAHGSGGCEGGAAGQQSERMPVRGAGRLRESNEGECRRLPGEDVDEG